MTTVNVGRIADALIERLVPIEAFPDGEWSTSSACAVNVSEQKAIEVLRETLSEIAWGNLS